MERYHDYISNKGCPARIYWLPSDVGVGLYIEGHAPTLTDDVRTLVLSTWLEHRDLSTSVLDTLEFLIQKYEHKMEILENEIRGEINKPQEKKRHWVSALLRGDG